MKAFSILILLLASAGVSAQTPQFSRQVTSWNYDDFDVSLVTIGADGYDQCLAREYRVYCSRTFIAPSRLWVKQLWGDGPTDATLQFIYAAGYDQCVSVDFAVYCSRLATVAPSPTPLPSPVPSPVDIDVDAVMVSLNSPWQSVTALIPTGVQTNNAYWQTNWFKTTFVYQGLEFRVLRHDTFDVHPNIALEFYLEPMWGEKPRSVQVNNAYWNNGVLRNKVLYAYNDSRCPIVAEVTSSKRFIVTRRQC